MPIQRLHLKDTALMVIDLQEKLMPLIRDGDCVQKKCIQLIRGAELLNIPTIVTEQYPKGIGPTVQPVRDALAKGVPVEQKLKFSASIEPVRKHLNTAGARIILVCGIETHVCVTQTVLDLLAAGFLVAVVTDAVGSRHEADHQAGLSRMIQAGAVPVTVEMALFELVHESGTERFKSILPIIK